MDDENWLIDFKTTRSGVHAEVALQLAAYARSEIDCGSRSLCFLSISSAFWLRPDQWKFVRSMSVKVVGHVQWLVAGTKFLEEGNGAILSESFG